MRSYRNLPSGTLTRARTLRRNATDAEKHLWRALRETFPAARFRRQMPIGPYFADFASFAARLIVEVDGGQHGEALDYDSARTHFMEAQGYRVLRFWNHDVLENIDGVLSVIGANLPLPSGEGRGEGEHPSSPRHPSPSPSQASPGPLPLPAGEGNSE